MATNSPDEIIKHQNMKVIAAGMSNMTIQQAALQGFKVEETAHIIAMALGFTIERARQASNEKRGSEIANEILFCLHKALYDNKFDVPEPTHG